MQFLKKSLIVKINQQSQFSLTISDTNALKVFFSVSSLEQKLQQFRQQSYASMKNLSWILIKALLSCFP